MSKAAVGNPMEPGQLNSVQLNIVTFVDVQNAVAQQTLDGNLYMVDNGLDHKNPRAPQLQTTCKQGQVLNWIIYALDMEQRPDKSWPPMAKLTNIVFLNQSGTNVAEHTICTEFKIYGGPDKMRSRWTPVYYYWAATVLPDLPPGIYKYRFVVDLETANSPLNLNYDGPSLNVIPMSGIPLG